MKLGLIGTGMVADMHVAATKATDGKADLKGVLGRDVMKTKSFADRHGVAAYESLDALASDAEVQAVIVATPPDARLEIVKALAHAGKAILLEKPIERDAARALEIVEICETANTPLGALLQHRMRPAAQTLIRRIKAGDLGQMATVDVRVPWWRPQSYYDAPGRGTFSRDGGGVLITQAIHTLDLMLQCAGPVKAVQAMTASSMLHELEAEDFAAAAVAFASGATGSIVASTTHFPGGGETITLNGTKASATLSAASLTIAHQDGRIETDGTAEATGGGADPMAFSHAWHQAVIEDFVAAVAAGQPPSITGRSALPAQTLIDAIQSSAQSGQRVTLGSAEALA